MVELMFEKIRLQNELVRQAVELQKQKHLKKVYREELESVREEKEQLEKYLRIKKNTAPTIIVESGGKLIIRGTGLDYVYSIK